MSNLMKKVSAVVLAIVMLICMMPLAVNADTASNTQDVSVYINDKLVGTVSADWIDANATDEYVYSKLQNGKKYSYNFVKAKGVDFEKLLKEAGAIDSSLYDELEGATIRFGSSAGAVDSKFDLTVNSDMQNAIYSFVENSIGEKASTETNKPIIAVAQTAGKTSFEDAKTADYTVFQNQFNIGQSSNDVQKPADQNANAKFSINPTVSVNIYINPNEMNLSDTEKEMKVGEEAELTTSFDMPAADKLDVTWESSDESVATVDENGKVTAVAPGTADITAKLTGKYVAAQSTGVADGNALEATCKVTVTEDKAPAEDPKSDDPKAEENPKAEAKAVNTGDTENVTMYFVLMIGAVAGAAFVLKRR